PAAPAVSVVVIGRNEGARLTACLHSVIGSQHPAGGLELIYVDSASTDGSPRRAAALGARGIEVPPARPGPAGGRQARGGAGGGGGGGEGGMGGGGGALGDVP